MGRLRRGRETARWGTVFWETGSSIKSVWFGLTTRNPHDVKCDLLIQCIMEFSLFLPLVTAGFGLIGVYVGGWLSDRREREKREVDFIIRQLTEFYGPLVSLEAEIRSWNIVNNKIISSAGQAWGEILKEAGQYGAEQKIKLHEERWPIFQKLIYEENKQFSDNVMPLYLKFFDIYKEKMWIAEPEARTYFPHLLEFIGIWQRHLKGSLPYEVLSILGHSEEKLKPLYDYINDNYRRLKYKLDERHYSNGTTLDIFSRYFIDLGGNFSHNYRKMGKVALKIIERLKRGKDI